MTDQSYNDYNSSLQNTRTKMIKSSKDIQKREDQLKSILNNVKKKGVKFLDDNEDEDHSEQTLKIGQKAQNQRTAWPKRGLCILKEDAR